MTNQYQTVKLPKGLLDRVKEQIKCDDSYLNASDLVRYAVRKLLNDLAGKTR
ncbi:ribbon-helix-helix domain-containing protein [Candidatus Woesearchaeota archaeon]|nr:ribbon-helix-helix domain-containing protein [Candidatus Woesearchaeota archaeon]MBW3021579.1 ribbon-helix-helix domain-containing protein [Candidatus Woesearchaeota archaeon]